MNLAEMIQQVSMDVPDAPLMTVRNALSWAARDFCKDADAWVIENQPIVVAANTEYPEVSASEGEPLRIVTLNLQGRDRQQGDGYFQPTPTSIRFDRKPSESILYGSLACRPKVGDMPPETVGDRWGEAFCNGARYRLLMMPQPWRDGQTATYYQRLFEQAKGEAKQQACLGHGLGSARVRLRPFI